MDYKIRYTFDGWYKEAECTNDFDFDTETVTADVTLYAKWTLNTYTFSYEMNGHGSAVDSETVSHGSKATGPETDPTDDDYAFWAWYADEELTTKYDFDAAVTANTTVYAKWTEKKTITYVTAFGTLAKESDRVGLGLLISEPTEPTYSGYAFNGWYTSENQRWNFTEDTVTGDMILSAKWTQYCTANFIMNGHGDAIESQEDLSSGAKVGKPDDPTAIGYVFGGWYTDAACEGKKWNFASDTITTNPLNLYAKWTPIEVAVTLLKNTGSSDGAAKVKYGENALDVTTVPVKNGASVEGYYTDSNFTKKVANADGTLIAYVSGYTNAEGRWIKLDATNLYARWSYTVTYVDPDDLLVSVPDTRTIKQGETLAYPSATPKVAAESGYEYRWSAVAPDNANQQVKYAPTTLDSNITLYYLKTYTGTDFDVKLSSGKYQITNYSGSRTSVTVPANIDGKKIYSLYDAFSYNSTVTDITVSEGIEVIGYNSFSHCTKLISVSLPKSVTRIGIESFRECSLLSTINIPDGSNLKYIDEHAFYWDDSIVEFVVPEGVIQVANSAFSDCENLETLRFPSTLSSMGINPAENCSKLTTLTVAPENEYFKSVDNAIYSYDGTVLYCVADCRTSFTIPSTVTRIAENAFAYNKKLTSIVIPDSVTEIGNNAFSSTKLQEVTISKNLSVISNYAFGRCTKLRTVTIQSGVTTILDNAFSGCMMLENVSIPDSVTDIGSGAFGYCNSITEFIFPESVTVVSGFVLGSCSGLTQITIPETVETIELRAFMNCSNLKSITFERNEVYEYPEDLLTGTHANLVIRVPAALVDSYKAADGWSDYASKIEAIPL